jgi:predicted MPP superfamily phosphohydrolase
MSWTVPAALLLCAAAYALYHWMFHIEPRLVEVTRHELFYPDLPESLDGLVLCQIADIHITASGRNAKEIAAAIRSIKADLYVLTGDQILGESGPEAFLRWFDELGNAIRPCVAVQGNAEHKKWFDPSPALRGLQERGVPVLNNATYCFAWGRGALQIVGVDDPHSGYDNFDRAYAGTDPNAWTLLLSHAPVGVFRLKDHRADLILSGHTHGGQVRIPLANVLVASIRRMHGLVIGWYEGETLRRKLRRDPGNTRLFVCRGLGMSGFGGRLICRPELSLFTLRRGDAARR